MIDTNPGARHLHEQIGFRAVREDIFSYMSGFLGFGGTTTIEHQTGQQEQ